MARTYNIHLKCGCYISEEGGGGILPCFTEECLSEKYFSLKEKMEKVEKRAKELHAQFYKETQELLDG